MTTTRRPTPLRIASVAAAASILLAACGGDDDAGAQDTRPAITIETFQFRPNPATVAAGVVAVTNRDDTTHTFTSGSAGEADGRFGLTLEGPDATGTVTLEPGTYAYFCEIHPSMTGELTVT